MKIQDRVAIVTGASSGIGLSIAKLLTSKGAKVALVARSKEKLKNLSKELPNSIAIPADMTKISEIKNMINLAHAHFGRIDILVNCAGQGYDAPVEKTNIDTLRYIFDLDFIGPLAAMQQMIPIMKEHGGGAIMNISSGTALMLLPYNGGYSAIKRALAHLSLTAREELSKDNIVVSVAYPYMTLTDFEKNTIKDFVPDSNEEEGGGPPFPLDPAEYIAQKIVEGIETGEPEIFAHDWMKKPQ